jgi:Condensation domain
MKRKLSVIEHLVFEVFEKENIHFAFTAGITGNFTLEELKLAVIKIKSKHPLLSSRIQPDSKGWTYFTHDKITEPLIRVVDRLNDETWIKEEWEELQTLIDLRNGPLTRFVWIKGKDVSEIIFVCHHIISDGRAAAYVLRDILHCLGDNGYEIKPHKMLPGISKLIPKRILFNPLFFLRTRIIALKKIKEIRKVKEINNSENQSRIYKTSYNLIHWNLSEAETGILIKKAREEKTGVHSIVYVSILEAFAKTLGKNEIPLFVKTPIDIKNKLTSRLKDDSLGTSFAVPKTLSYKYKIRKSFWQMAKEIKEELSKQIDKKKFYYDMVLLELMKPVASSLVDSLFPVNTDNVSHLTLSNMGNLDIPIHFRNLNLNFFQVSAPVVGNEHMLLFMSIGGKIYFTLVTSSHKFDMEKSLQLKGNFNQSIGQAVGFNESKAVLSQIKNGS